MPKKTLKLQDREFSEKCYFRWEFIRRNSNYQNDNRLFISRFLRWFEDRGVNLVEIHGYDGLYWDDFLNNAGSQAERYFADEIQSYVHAFLEKWGLAWPCDPNVLFETDRLDVNAHAQATLLANYRSTPVIDLRQHLRLEISLSSLSTKPQECEPPEILEMARRVDKESEERRESYFEVLRRLGFHRSLTQTDWTRISSALSPRAPGRYRLRLQQYGQYLEVWDFKEMVPEATWPEVARTLYYEEFAKYEYRKDQVITNATIQRAKVRYKRAEELINGGFVEIK